MKDKRNVKADQIVLCYMGLVSDKLTELGVSGEVSAQGLFEAYQELRRIYERNDTKEQRDTTTSGGDNVYFI